MAIVEVGEVTYHLNDKLKLKWDKLRAGGLAKDDEDRIYVVDGAEGVGKSLFAIQQAAFLDPTILEDGKNGDALPRICFSVKEFINSVRQNRSTKEKTKVVLFDEAFRGLSSKSSLSKSNKLLVQALQEARQQNLVIFLVTPSFFMLEFYAAVLRTNALFHVVKERKSKRRYVRIFGKRQKNILYQVGVRKGWSYNVKTRSRASFFNIYPGGSDFEKRYRAKKRANFGVDDGKSKAEVAYFDKSEEFKKQRDILLYFIKEHIERTPNDPKNSKFSYAKMSKMFKELGFNIIGQHIGAIVSDVRHKLNKDRDLVPSKDLAEQEDGPNDENLPDFG